MSISGYFKRRHLPLQMPRNDGFDPKTGARYEGDILTGKISVEDAFRRDADRALQEQLRRNPKDPSR